MKKTLIEISPNPLISAGVEIRFDTNLFKQPNERLNFFYKILSDKFPDLENRNSGIIIDSPKIPLIEYTFRNGGNSISIGDGLLLFENTKNYPLWESFFKLIKSNLLLFSKNGFSVSSISRIGIRYISLLPNANSITEATMFDTSFEVPEYKLTSEVVRNQYSDDKGSSFTLQVANGIKASVDGEEKVGLYVDIDAAKTKIIQKEFNQELFDEIDNLHTLEKDLFVSIFTEQYKKTLSFKY